MFCCAEDLLGRTADWVMVRCLNVNARVTDADVLDDLNVNEAPIGRDSEENIRNRRPPRTSAIGRDSEENIRNRRPPRTDASDYVSIKNQ